MVEHPRLAAAFLASILSTGAALAQPSASTASFCDVAGTYMEEISAQRAAGAAMDTAIKEVALAFDAFATDSDDLANRRRILQTSRPLAAFAYGLGDLQPATVKEVGTARCLARDGDVSLAPAPTTTAAISAEAGQCERRADGTSVDASCITKAVGAHSTTASAEPSERSAGRSRERSRIQPFYELAGSWGGDAIGSIPFVSGDTQEIDAGQGGSVGGGVIQRINDRFGIKYTASYKFQFGAASNADVMKTVIPIDIIPYYRTGDHKVGVGLSYHVSPKVDWDWLQPTMNFDDAAGITLEYAFRGFGFSYTDIDYELGPATYDASHLTFKWSSKF